MQKTILFISESIFRFFIWQFLFHKNDYEIKLEKISKNDDTLYQNLLDIKSKFEQVLDSNRTGLFTEITQREYYEKFSTVNIEL